MSANPAQPSSGLSVPERAEALTAIAHPDFRDELSEASERIGQPL